MLAKLSDLLHMAAWNSDKGPGSPSSHLEAAVFCIVSRFCRALRIIKYLRVGKPSGGPVKVFPTFQPTLRALPIGQTH